jgi:hypothetical protein
MSELEAILPVEFAARIKRVGIVNAMEAENFAAAVRATRAQEADHRRRHQRCVHGLSSAQPGTRGLRATGRRRCRRFAEQDGRRHGAAPLVHDNLPQQACRLETRFAHSVGKLAALVES